jgi:hypothetical protein
VDQVKRRVESVPLGLLSKQGLLKIKSLDYGTDSLTSARPIVQLAHPHTTSGIGFVGRLLLLQQLAQVPVTGIDDGQLHVVPLPPLASGLARGAQPVNRSGKIQQGTA